MIKRKKSKCMIRHGLHARTPTRLGILNGVRRRDLPSWFNPMADCDAFAKAEKDASELDLLSRAGHDFCETSVSLRTRTTLVRSTEGHDNKIRVPCGSFHALYTWYLI